jgi:DNA mismatch repair protein MutS
MKFLRVLLLLFVVSTQAQQGGMWIPSLLKGMNEKEMKSLGMKMSASDIYDVNKSSLKDAVPHFNGGCTSEVISPKGLLLTNHHCGFDEIQSHSSLENDYITDGFWAMKMEDELPNKDLVVTFIVKIEDVTAQVLEGTQTLSEAEKQKKIQQNISSLAISTSGKEYLEGIERRESEKTGISSLKISFNNVFGYYIEVRNTHKDKVPAEWIRKQTLVNAERYITEELKEYETKILGAEEKIYKLEVELFEQLVGWIAIYIKPVQVNANLVAQLDCLTSFTQLALENKYVCPELDDTFELEIKNGRHPVIEKQLPVGIPYIANDVYLDRETQQIIMITGPNMSGKSAILRQTALIVLLAQMGSFVPADSVRMGVVDKIFTRVGASDNISMGESTFMVEMNETASILNNISDRSLVLLDEIGRGTSTYDGISIAWAIAEYLHEHPSKPKTLFATHYHELNEMTDILPRIQNYNVSVKELKDTVLFIRKLVKGGSAHSFGIHVAKMAGMPQTVILKAQKLLKKLEKDHSGEALNGIKSAKDEMQMSFFNLDDPLLEEIKDEILNIDINTLTPVEALMKLNEIKRMLTNK